MNPHLINNSYKYEQYEDWLLDDMKHPTVFCSRFREDQWYCSILVVFFGFGLPVGLLGNMAAILNYTCCLRPWSTGTVFLLNLALCDLAWLLLMPFSLYFSIHHLHFTGFCQLKKVFFIVNVYGSIFFLALVSFDRYTGTVHPISSLQWWNRRRALLCSLFTWLFLMLASIPEFLVTFDLSRLGNATICMDQLLGPFPYVMGVSITRALVGFFLPFGVMVTLYARMVRVLWTTPWRGGAGRSRGRGRLPRRSAKPLVLITAALLVFLASYAPYHVMILTLAFMRLVGRITARNTNTLYTAYQFFEAICSVGSCLDPVLYILASERFHRSWRRLRGGAVRLCSRAGRRVGAQEPT
ncbi:P2Y purinoceptor 1-like [Brachyhypopomus gauderio]|uniref:P2Y purinoceptor 1-like n=1 Tax=Brachyhypopomus gauderio TaxID=698409 RepID=UPI0040412B2B